MSQMPESEIQLRGTVGKLKKTIARQKTEIEDLRRQVANLALASADLTCQAEPDDHDQPRSDNVVSIHRTKSDDEARSTSSKA